MKKITVLLFALILISSLIVSCSGSGGVADTSAPIGNESTPVSDTSAPETAAPETEPTGTAPLIGGDTVLKIITPLRPTANESAAAAELAEAITAKLGYTPATAADNAAADKTAVEILVGKTNRAEYRTSVGKLKHDGDWCIANENAKLVITARSDGDLENAVDYFIADILNAQEDGFTLPFGFSYYSLVSENELFLSIMKDYTLIRPAKADARLIAATDLFKSALESRSDGKFSVATDETEAGAHEIIVGSTNRTPTESSVGLGYYDYLIRTDGDNIVVSGGSSVALTEALGILPDLIIDRRLGEPYLYRFAVDPIARDQSLFVPAWKDSATVPEWLTDFNEKLYAITNPTGRLMCVAHRGDVVNYPENSLKGYLSAALLGADVIEMDIQYTLDGYLVMMHDTSLKTTTDFAAKAGKNGLPTSDKLSDWTYEQLQLLNLYTRDKTLTDLRIPTLYEVMLTLRGRCFTLLDVKCDGVKAEEILALERSADSLECSIYSMFVSASSGPAAKNSYSYLTDYSKKNPELTRFAAYIEKLTEYMSLSGHTIRTRGWINGMATVNIGVDRYDRYDFAHQQGVTLLYCNNMPMMMSYLSEKFTPDLP